MILPSAGFDGGCAACLAGPLFIRQGRLAWELLMVPSGAIHAKRAAIKLGARFLFNSRCNAAKNHAVTPSARGGLGALGARDTDS